MAGDNARQVPGQARWRDMAARAAGSCAGSLLLMLPFLAIAWPVIAKPDALLIAYACVQIVSAALIAATVSAHGARARDGDDRLTLVIVSGLLVASQVLAALDLTLLRLADFQAPWLRWSGLAGMVTGFALRLWAVRSNPFFTVLVAVQTAAGHHVVETGPYARVRHPAYLGSSLVLLCMPLALGSGLAALPAALAAWRLVIRTRLEDDRLLEQLPGYRTYAERVRSRLLPGIY